MNGQFPADFPPFCPPEEATAVERQVYRLVTHDPPFREDFISTKQEQAHKVFRGQKLCQACGVSVYSDIDDAIKTRAFFQHLQSKKVAVGVTVPEYGKSLETPGYSDTHLTWWLYTDAQPQTAFQVCDEE